MYSYISRPMMRRCIGLTASTPLGAKLLRLPRDCRHGSVMKVNMDFVLDREERGFDGSFVL